MACDNNPTYIYTKRWGLDKGLSVKCLAPIRHKKDGGTIMLRLPEEPMSTELVVQRDQRLEPIQGRALMKCRDSDPVQLEPETRVYFKPKVVVFLFMAIGGMVAFFIGAMSL